MYQGGKARLAKRIGAVIREHADGRTRYVEPFMGGASVLAEVAPDFRDVVAADVVPDIALLWAAARDGWVPPSSVSEDEYAALRHAEPSPLRGFVGANCSFAGKWWGGYARGACSNYAAAGSRSTVRRGARLSGVEILHADYRDLGWLIDADTVVYCDPPYAGTLAYKGAPDFDSAAFWRVAEDWSRRGAVVLVSEYVAPEGWRSVWCLDRHTSTARDSAGHRATEHVFRWAS